MSYFADLSPYTYSRSRPFDPKVLNVGWLDPAAPFCKGPVQELLLKRLFRLASDRPENRYRGWHECRLGLLESPPYACPYPVIAELAPWTLVVGDAEIRIPCENGIVYSAPTMICHYIAQHGYRPPDEFLKAVSRI